jgi:glycosyltransferase involved in cell wall biosynthesis
LVLPKLGMSLSPFTLARAARPAIARLLDEGFDFDVMDAHYFYPDGVAAALLARYFNKPLVITARGSDINLLAQYAVPRRLMQWAAQQASACVGVSHALTQRMAHLGFPAERLMTLPNGVDLAVFALKAQAPARMALAWPHAPTLLCVGNLVENKGQHLAIEALLHLPHFRLVLVGEGPQRAALERLAAKLKLKKRVQFLGQLAPAQLALCYSATDMLVLPSSREGWPNVLLEAMACGTPVVATKVGGVTEIVRLPAAGQLMAERTVAALVEAVQALWRHLPAPEAVRACALAHSWQATTQAQLQLFHAVVSAGPIQAASFTARGDQSSEWQA